MIAQPGVPTKPLTLYVNKAQIASDFHGNATWGASQAGIAKAVAEALENGTLPPEAGERLGRRVGELGEPADRRSRRRVREQLPRVPQRDRRGDGRLPHRDAVFAAARDVSNPFYTPKKN